MKGLVNRHLRSVKNQAMSRTFMKKTFLPKWKYKKEKFFTTITTDISLSYTHTGFWEYWKTKVKKVKTESV